MTLQNIGVLLGSHYTEDHDLNLHHCETVKPCYFIFTRIGITKYVEAPIKAFTLVAFFKAVIVRYSWGY
jgi:hypothetical protein